MSIKDIKTTVENTYHAIEDGVVGTYKTIENGVVGAYKKVEDTCIEKLFAKEGESVEDAKERLKKTAEDL